MVRSNILLLVGAGVIAYFLFKNNSSVSALPSDVDAAPSEGDEAPSEGDEAVPGYRTKNIISSSDVGSSKVLPIVSTHAVDVAPGSKASATKTDIIAYNIAATATNKIKAAVKILPAVQSAELSSNLKKLGW